MIKAFVTFVIISYGLFCEKLTPNSDFLLRMRREGPMRRRQTALTRQIFLPTEASSYNLGSLCHLLMMKRTKSYFQTSEINLGWTKSILFVELTFRKFSLQNVFVTWQKHGLHVDFVYNFMCFIIGSVFSNAALCQVRMEQSWCSTYPPTSLLYPL